MVLPLFDSDLDVVIRSGFIHVPLLFDPSVDREIHMAPTPATLLQVNGRHFVKGLSLRSLLEQYPALHPESNEELRRACLRDCAAPAPAHRIPLDAKLSMILFQIMPHFIRRHKGFARAGPTEGDILDLIGRKVTIPHACYEEARALSDPQQAVHEALGALEERGRPIEPPPDGLVSARAVGDWVRRATARSIVGPERDRLRRALGVPRESVEAERGRLAVLLHILREGSLEIDGFGFSRIAAGQEYVLYKRTGAYALRDYYGRLYLFPDCSVGISTRATLRPYVMEEYKHPFLEGYAAGQHICLRAFSPPNAFTPDAVITALEEGISALLYGYSARRRNGYHSLDRVTARSTDGDIDRADGAKPMPDPRGRRQHFLDVTFDDYRVSSDDPRIVSGEVPITNQDTL